MEDVRQHSANGLMTQEIHYGKKSKGRNSKDSRNSKSKPRESRQPMEGKVDLLKTDAGTGFKEADFELALKNTEKKSNRFSKGEENGMTTDISYFRKYGPGVSLFFQFQWALIKTYFLMSIISLVPTVYNYLTGPVMDTKGTSLAYIVAKTTIGNFSSSHADYQSLYKFLNVIPDMVLTLIFIIFYFYWLKKGNSITEEIRKEVQLKSYNVLELVEFPARATEEDVERFMSQFGSVVEVAPVRNYKETIYLSKKIFDLEIELKKLEMEKSRANEKDIKDVQEKIDDYYRELVKYEDDTKEEVIQYYVVFSSVEQKLEAIRVLKEHEKKMFDCCGPDTPASLKLCDEKVVVKACHTQPGEIIWENQHITWATRWIRVLIQNLILFAAIAAGFLLISYLNILVPSASSNVDTSAYNSVSIMAETNTTIVQSWCIANQVSVLQAGSGAPIYTYCWDYIYQALLKTGITIGIAIAVVLIKFILKHLAIFLSQFRRYKTHAEQSRSMVLNLFFVYVATTVLITLLIQANLLSISFKSLITVFVSNDYVRSNSESMSEYSDFVADWYVSIGYQIIFNCIILVFHPTFSMPFYYCISEKVAHCRASGEKIQAQMEKRLLPEQFELESDYAEILTLVFMSLAFCGSMPVIVVITFLALFLRYFFEKYYFFRYCRIPKTFDEALDLQVSSLLPYAIIIHFCFSLWMFGNTEIFAFDEITFSSLTTNTQSGFVESIGFILERVFGTWYYSAFFVLFLLVWIFKQILYNCIAKSCMENPKSEKHIQSKQMKDTNVASFVSTKSLTNSYKIESNPDYVEVLEIMRKKRKFIIKIKGFPPAPAAPGESFS